MDDVALRISLDRLVEQEETRPGFFDLLPYDFDRMRAMVPEVIAELEKCGLERITSDEPKFPRPRSVPVRPLVKAGGWFTSRFNFNRRR